MLNKKKTLIGQNHSQRSDTKCLFCRFIGWMQVGELKGRKREENNLLQTLNMRY